MSRCDSGVVTKVTTVLSACCCTTLGIIRHLFWLTWPTVRLFAPSCKVCACYIHQYRSFMQCSSRKHEEDGLWCGFPLPQIDIIGAVVIVWRVRGELSGLFCAILCATIVHSAMHAHMNRLAVLWIGFCLTGPISLCLYSFLYCVLLCVVCMIA